MTEICVRGVRCVFDLFSWAPARHIELKRLISLARGVPDNRRRRARARRRPERGERARQHERRAHGEEPAIEDPLKPDGVAAVGGERAGRDQDE